MHQTYKIHQAQRPIRPLANLELPSDMKGGWDDQIYEHERHHRSQPFKIIWQRDLSDGKLTDPKWSLLWETLRRYYCYLRGYRSRPVSRSTAFACVNIAIKLCEWLTKCGYTSFSQVSYDALQNLTSTIEEGSWAADGEKRKTRKRPGKSIDVDALEQASGTTYAKSHLSQIRSVIWELHDLYVHPMDGENYALGDGFRYSVEAFSDYNEAGKDHEQTEDLAPDLVFQYTDAALQFLYDYSDEIIELKDRNENLVSREVSRARPGDRLRQLAAVLYDEVTNDRSQLFSASGPIYPNIASKLGMDATSIHKPRYKQLIAECFKHRQDESGLDAIKYKLQAIATKTGRIVEGENARDRGASVKLGLPYFGKKSGSASPWPIEIVGFSANSSKMSLERAVVDLWTASIIIILAWQGERTGQILDLDVDCLDQRLDGWYIKSRKFKDRNDTIGTATFHPCPLVVVKAVHVATKLGAAARASEKSTKLFFRTNRLRDSIPDQSALRRQVADFGERYVNDPNSAGIKLIPRHLRRFFPTLWIHYYSYGGKFRALQRYLDHGSLSVTVLYGRRSSNLDPIRESQTRLALHVLGEHVQNGLALLGGAAKKVETIVARLNFKLGTPAEVAEKLMTEVRENEMRILPINFGYCVWDKTAVKHRACELPGDGADINHWPTVGKTESVCGGCSNLLTTSTFRTFWEASEFRHQALENDERAPTHLRRLGRKGRLYARRFLRAFNAK